MKLCGIFPMTPLWNLSRQAMSNCMKGLCVGKPLNIWYVCIKLLLQYCINYYCIRTQICHIYENYPYIWEKIPLLQQTNRHSILNPIKREHLLRLTIDQYQSGNITILLAHHTRGHDLLTGTRSKVSVELVPLFITIWNDTPCSMGFLISMHHFFFGSVDVCIDDSALCQRCGSVSVCV